MDVTVTVYPEEGEMQRIAKALLAVADHPYQVLTVSNPRFGFKVPEEVFNRFHAAQEQAWETEEDEVAQEETPKRRGRPRRNPMPEQESQGAVDG